MSHSSPHSISVLRGRCVLRLAVLAAALAVPPSAAQAGVYAFLVGVRDYDDKQLKPLTFSRDDIVSFRDVLIEAGVPKGNVVLLHDDLKSLDGVRYLATGDRIRKELKVLLQTVGDDDALIVALAGHGVQFKGEPESYFCPVDADLADRDSLVSLSEIYQSLQACPSRQKLLLCDACRNDPTSNLARTAGVPDLETVTLPQLAKPPEGIVALFSCAEGQQAFEHPDLKHGIFFYHVLEAFRGKADDGNEQLTIDEIISFTKSNTTQYARTRLGAAQTPRQQGFFEGEWILRNMSQGVLRNSLGMELRPIPSGAFLMGSNLTPPELARRSTLKMKLFDDESPTHRVQITEPFFLGTYEVTQLEYERVMGRNPSAFADAGDAAVDVEGLPTQRFPVENVSWNDAVEFCRKLSSLPAEIEAGRVYRLPTEAEWEYACRAGTSTLFHFGDECDGTQANCDGTKPFGSSAGPALLRTQVVGSYPPNAFGLHDMHGNVWEWCADRYGANYYADSPVDNPRGPAGGTTRVLRGGCWADAPGFLLSSARTAYAPDYRSFYFGFRVACVKQAR
jgi:formylglycine-generating enzyme required for sulfatase activity